MLPASACGEPDLQGLVAMTGFRLFLNGILMHPDMAVKVRCTPVTVPFCRLRQGATSLVTENTY